PPARGGRERSPARAPACLSGAHARGPGATRLARRARAGGGCERGERPEPLWETTREKAARYFAPPSLARLAVRWAGSARRLVRSWRPDRPPPLVVVGFGGQLDVLLAARFCRPRAGLVFPPLGTLRAALVEGRRVFRAR